MGLSLSSIHIFGDIAPANCGFSFKSFSPGRMTCVDDFSEKAPDYSYKAAKKISQETEFPVLLFDVFDSDMIEFDFFIGGKIVAGYSDYEYVSNKKLYDIPKMAGYEEGNKKRFSNILACSDTELKINMLEEFFGVCLLYDPELADSEDIFFRLKSEAVYNENIEAENAITGKQAPIKVRLISQYPGKIFNNRFGESRRTKPHFYLYGYTDKSSGHILTPVEFTGKGLEPTGPDIYSQQVQEVDQRFIKDKNYYMTNKITFSDMCPGGYRGKTMTLPPGFYPFDFLPSGKFLIEGMNRIYIVDENMKIISKQSVKGEISDIIDNYILTTTGDSFCGYCYDPKAKVYIYEIV